MTLQRNGSRRSVFSRIGVDRIVSCDLVEKSDPISIKTPPTPKRGSLSKTLTKIGSFRKMVFCDSSPRDKDGDHSHTCSESMKDIQLGGRPMSNETADQRFNTSMSKLLSSFFDIVETNEIDVITESRKTTAEDSKVNRGAFPVITTEHSPAEDKLSVITSTLTPKEQHIIKRLNSNRKIYEDLNLSMTFNGDDLGTASRRGNSLDSINDGSTVQHGTTSRRGNSLDSINDEESTNPNRIDYRSPTKSRNLVAVRIRPRGTDSGNGDLITLNQTSTHEVRTPGQRVRAFVKAYSSRDLFTRKGKSQTVEESSNMANTNSDTFNLDSSEKAPLFTMDEDSELGCKSERNPRASAKAKQSADLGSKSERRSTVRTKNMNLPDESPKPRTRTPKRHSMGSISAITEAEREIIYMGSSKTFDTSKAETKGTMKENISRVRRSPGNEKPPQADGHSDNDETLSVMPSQRVRAFVKAYSSREMFSRKGKSQSDGESAKMAITNSDAFNLDSSEKSPLFTMDEDSELGCKSERNPYRASAKAKQSADLGSKSERRSSAQTKKSLPVNLPKPRTRTPKRHSMGSISAITEAEREIIFMGSPKPFDTSKAETKGTMKENSPRVRRSSGNEKPPQADGQNNDDAELAVEPSLSRQKSLDRLLDDFFDIIGDK